MSDVTTPQGGKAMSPASAGSVAGKPVAWMVTDPSGRIEACRESFGEAAQLATDFTATEDGDVVYKVFAVYSQPQPSLTGMERDAVEWASKTLCVGWHDLAPEDKQRTPIPFAACWSGLTQRKSFYLMTPAMRKRNETSHFGKDSRL